MMNPEDRSVTQQVSSLLLRYPDETLDHPDTPRPRAGRDTSW